jgi:hypothetical protein
MISPKTVQLQAPARGLAGAGPPALTSTDPPPTPCRGRRSLLGSLPHPPAVILSLSHPSPPAVPKSAGRRTAIVAERTLPAPRSTAPTHLMSTTPNHFAQAGLGSVAESRSCEGSGWIGAILRPLPSAPLRPWAPPARPTRGPHTPRPPSRGSEPVRRGSGLGRGANRTLPPLPLSGTWAGAAG